MPRDDHERPVSPQEASGSHLRSTGIGPVGDARWGTHFCHFYETRTDLLDLLVPYFKAGLESNEFCMWITSEPLTAAEAEAALRRQLPDLDDYIRKGQIEILDYREWYTKGGSFDADRVLDGWVAKERSARENGFDGLRLTGNTFWLEESDWRSFADYEAKVNSVIGQYRMIALCSYALDKCGPHEFMDVVHNHQFALVKREGRWEILASSALQEARTRYETLFEQAPDGVVVIDPETGAFVEFNDQAHRQLGYSREEFAGLRLTDIEAAEALEETSAHIQEVLRRGRDDFETRHRAKDGEIRDVLVTAQTVQLSGRVLLQCFFRDITQRKRVEEALADQSALLQSERDLLDTIMQNTEAHLAYLDPQFNFVRINCTYAAGSGYAEEDLIGRNHFDVFPDEENQAIFQRVRDTGEAVEFRAKPFEFAGQPERGVTYWDWTLIPIRQDSGEVQGLVLSLLDVTERIRGQQAALRAKEEWERTFDADPDLIAILDQRYHVLRANRAMAERLGLTPDECIGKVCYQVVHGLSCPPEFCPHAPSLVDGCEHTAEVTEPRLGGEFVVTISPLLDELGKRVGSVHVARDITERKRVEEVVRRSREDLDRAQAVAHVGSWRLDVRRNELSWSDEAYRIFGIPQGTPLTYETFLAAVHPDDRDYVDREWTAALRGEPYDIEHRIVVDENVRWVREQAGLEFDERGAALGGFGTVQDITERKQAEEALERLRSEFTGMVTHELKTPLTAIKGSAATALGSARSLGAEESRELFEIIDEQADRLRELMDNLLDATRIEAGTLSVSPEPNDLREVLEEARATFTRSGGRHEVQLELPPDMPQVSADRRRIFQVFMNLLNNAAMFSPSTEPITIAVELETLQITVHVRDRGRGIAREKLPLLFKKFSRLHDDTGQKLSGTGLGLAICKGIVEAHGGRIWAESEGEGQGSTFSFTLPVATEAGVLGLPDESRRAAHMGKVRRPGEKTRVLAVDDEPQIVRFLQRSLDEAGYQPVVTTDPSQVTKLVEMEEPDLVLLDLMLPGTSGFELLERIREFSGVPVIFLTASDREEDTVRALKMGADDYITKPFSPSELLARIEAALRRRTLADVMEVRPPFVLGDLTINFAERRVTVAGQPVVLSATEYKILYALATRAGRPLTYEQILQEVWGPEYSQETELVRSFIRNLRRKLGDDAREPRFILTERQVGYRMPKP